MGVILGALEGERIRMSLNNKLMQQVERVARALQRHDFQDQQEADKIWSGETDDYKENYRRMARAAISALTKQTADPRPAE